MLCTFESWFAGVITLLIENDPTNSFLCSLGMSDICENFNGKENTILD